MSTPRYTICRCGHSKTDHEALAPQCSALHCECLRYVPTTVPPSMTGSVAVVPTVVTNTLSMRPVVVEPTAEQLIAAGKRSEFKRTVSLADKIGELVADLRARLAEERDTADARREVAELEAKLAAAKAKLRSAAPPASAGDGKCPDCGKTGLSNVGVHRARAHSHRKSVAS